MERKENMPAWVFWGIKLMGIETKKGAMNIVLASAAFTLLFIPFPLILDDWSWMDVLEYSGTMFLITLWYGASMQWVDQHACWEE
jgi:hypothetical protein